MNIAIFTDSFYPQINGVVTAVDNLTKGLAKKGHRVLIVAPRHRKTTYVPSHQNIELLTVSGGPAYFYRDMRIAYPFSKKIHKKLKEFQPDLFHFHTPLTLGFQAILFARIFSRPLVGTFHTFFTESEYLKHAKLDYKIMQQLAWKLVRFYYNKCDLISTPSPKTTNILKENNCNAPLITISNGIDPAIFQTAPNSQNLFPLTAKTASGERTARARTRGLPEVSLPKKGLKALYVGRLAHEKNIPQLISIFQKVVQRNPSAQLFLVGDGPQKKTIQKFILKNGLQQNIVLLGQIPHEKLLTSGIYKSCDIFITASKTETQGITILEALANQLPVIAMASKGITDLIESGVNGFLVPEDDATAFTQSIERMIQNPREHKKIRSQTLQTIEKHHMDKIIEEWEKAYQQAVKTYALQKTGTEA